MVDIGLSMSVVEVAMVVDRRRMGRGLRIAVDMMVGRKFAELGSRRLKTDLSRQMFGNRKDLVIAVRRNLRNRPLRDGDNESTLSLGKPLSVVRGMCLSQYQSPLPNRVKAATIHLCNIMQIMPTNAKTCINRSCDLGSAFNFSGGP